MVPLPFVYFASLALINAGSHVGYIDTQRRTQMMKDIAAITNHMDATIVLQRGNQSHEVILKCKNHVLQAILKMPGNPLDPVMHIDNKALTEPLCSPKPFETYAGYCKRVHEQYSLFADATFAKIMHREQPKN